MSKRARWFGVATLFLIVAISYIDRINIAILVTDSDFLDHFGLAQGDRSRQGLLSTAFMLGYAFSNFLLTPLCAAFLGVRRSLLCGLVLWGVVTAVSPFMAGWSMLLASRLLLGVAEGPLYGLASSYIKAHFAGSENGKPNSLVNMGTGIGLALGYPLISGLVAGLHWQGSFYVLGAINVIVGIPLVWAFIRMPERPEYKRSSGSASVTLKSVGQTFSQALQTPYVLPLTVLTSVYLAYMWGSANWLPAYLKSARGFTMTEMGWLGSLPQYAIVVGVLFGGILIDRMPRHHLPLIFVFGSVATAISVLSAIGAEGRFFAVGYLTAAGFFWGMQSPSIPSILQYYAHPEHVASAMGFTNGAGALTSAFMPVLMGWVIGRGQGAAGAGTEDFSTGFALLVGTQVVVLLCGLWLWRGERLALGRAQAGDALLSSRGAS